QRIAHAELRRLKTIPGLGPAPRRSALRKNRRLARAERERRESEEVKIDNFFAELKRRNVYKVAVAYAVVAWLLFQAASILLPTFEAPTWVMKAFTVFLVLGFVFAVFISWAFEMTPGGMKRTVDISPDEVRSFPYWSKRKFAAFI